MADLKLVTDAATPAAPPVADAATPAYTIIPLTANAKEALATIASLTEMSQAGCDLAEDVFISLTSRLQEARVVDAENHFLGYNHGLSEGGFLVRMGPAILAVAPGCEIHDEEVVEHLLFDGLAHEAGGDPAEMLEATFFELLTAMSPTVGEFDS